MLPKNSSIVGTILLQENKIYKTVSEVYEEIKKLNGEITLVQFQRY